jgi:hypothetical protein
MKVLSTTNWRLWAGGFDVEHAGVFLDGTLDVVGAGGVDVGEVEAEVLEHQGEEAVDATVDGAGDDDVVAALEEGHDGVDGGHAGGKGEGVAAAFEVGEVALERGAGGVAGAGVVVALVFAHRLLDVGGGLIDGDGNGARTRVGFLPDMNGIGGEAHGVKSSVGGAVCLADLALLE